MLQQIPQTNIRLIQWNARSIINKKPNLANFLKDHPTEIILLSETWNNPRTPFTLKGYDFIHRDRHDNKGGVGILVSKTIKYRVINVNNILNHSLEICAVYLPDLNVTVVSVYRPPNINVNKTDWENLFASFSTPAIIGGDFNAHHNLWGSTYENCTGRRLVEALDDSNYVVLNDGSPTRLTAPNAPPSPVDLTFVSSDLYTVCSWKVSSDTLGSDHFPIIICINIQYEPLKIIPTSKWKENAADWMKFEGTVLDNIKKLDMSVNNPDMFTTFLECVARAADSSMPQKKSFTPTCARPCWFDDECSDAILKRKEALKKYKSLSNLENYLNYKKHEAIAKKILLNKSRSSWRAFVSGLNKNTPPSKIWNFIKKISNKKYQLTKSPLTEELIEELLNKLAPPYVNTKKQLFNRKNPNVDLLEKPFTIVELEKILENTVNTSPGIDNITYSLISRLPEAAKICLLRIFNGWWVNNDYVTEMKKIVVCTILKPGKDETIADSYRPISLLSCITKTFEKLVKVRLEWFFEHNSLLPANQFGFRRGTGTTDAVTKLVTNVQKGFSSNKYVACLFLDLKGAYDCVNLDVLTDIMVSCGLSVNAASNITELYRDRIIYLRDQYGTLHGPRTISQGLPQGSVLSPLLFNIYTANIHNLWDDSISCVQYADDFCFYTIQDTYRGCLSQLRHIMYVLSQYWLSTYGFTISQEKSAIMIFSRHRKTYGDSLNLSTYEIPVVQHYKYLGIILDKKLSWAKHINHVKNKCEKGINMLKCIAKVSSGTDPKIALMFYRAYIRSIIDYGSTLYGSASHTNLLIIDRIQYKAIRICIGAMRSSPNPTILSEAQEPPLYLRRQFLSEKYVLKCRVFNMDMYSLFGSLSTYVLTAEYWSHKNNPPLIDAFTDTVQQTNQLNSFKTQLIFDLPYEVCITIPTVIFPKYNDVSNIDRLTFYSLLDKYPDHRVIYTDGSKSNTYTACAYYVAGNSNISSIYNINQSASIYAAEAYAIDRALSWILNQDLLSNFIIASDSRSVLHSLKYFSRKHHRHNLICEIIHKIYQLNNKNVNVIFVWCKAHVGIQGNEIVDGLAKQGRKAQMLDSVMLFTDMYSFFKKKMRLNWESSWTEYVSSTNTNYAIIHPILPSNLSYISEYKVSRFYSTQITRMKINHGRFPSHLNKIGILDTPACTCDMNTAATLNHLFFACRNNLQAINQLHFNLKRCGLSPPYNLNCLLALDKREIYDALIAFLCQTNICI